MRNHAVAAVALCNLVIAFSPSSPLAEPNPKLRGVFSNLSYHQEAGDLLGIEIIVVPGRSGNFALVQHAEGSMHDPILVPLIENSSGEVSFTIPKACPCGLSPGRYLAIVSLGALRTRGLSTQTSLFPKTSIFREARATGSSAPRRLTSNRVH